MSGPGASGPPNTRVRPPNHVVRYGKLRVTVTRGPDAGVFVDVAGSVLRVGSAPDNDLVLSDDSVSRHHGEIEPIGSGVRVRDAGSTNGIVAGGVQISDGIVPFESRLRLGDTELSLSPLTDAVEREQTNAERFGDLVGRSPRMRELFADLERIAASELTVLIEGETGTGKEVIAESIHGASARRDGPFVVFDCGAVSPALVESELFGHERGAFTGAVASREGVFEQADGGTLFLDELGELPKDLQPKLLRALESRQARRVGGTKTFAFDVRVVAATNRNLRAEVARGAFREDLYFRVAAAHVVSPPLRDRKEDIPLLVEHFLSMERPARSTADMPEHVWALLQSYRWPGNVRELRNTVQRLLVTPNRALDALAAPYHAPSPDAPVTTPEGELLPFRIARREATEAFERRYVTTVLARSNGNVSQAARLAELSRAMVQKLSRKYGMRRDS